MDTVETAVRTVGALAAVLALIWIATRLTRSRLGVTSGPQVRIVQRVGLGRRTAVTLLRVGDRCLLVGVGDSTVTLLAEIDEPTDETPAPPRLTAVASPTLGATPRGAPVPLQRPRAAGVRGMLAQVQDRTVRR